LSRLSIVQAQSVPSSPKSDSLLSFTKISDPARNSTPFSPRRRSRFDFYTKPIVFV
jgi:hypothetical protein